jgi:hypothetical protein
MTLVNSRIKLQALILLFAFLFLAYSAPYQQQITHSFVHQNQIVHYHHDNEIYMGSEKSRQSQKESDSPHKHNFRSVSFILPVSVSKACFQIFPMIADLVLGADGFHQPSFGTIHFFGHAPPFSFRSKVYILFPPHHAPPLA